MTTSTLTTYYCNFCDTVANFFKGQLENTKFDPRFNSKTYGELNALSDHELRDIGISRGEIMHIAMGGEPFRGGRN